MTIKSVRSQPRANSKTIASSDERADILELLQSYGEIPTHCMTLLYKSRYGKILDCLDKQIEGGLLGYLKSMLGDVIVIREEPNGNMFVSINQVETRPETKENIQPLLKKRLFERDIKAFFNPDSILWRGSQSLLDRRNLKIELSPFEQSRIIRRKEFENEVKRIRTELKKHPDGIEMGEFGYRITISTKVFPGIANNHIISDLPELFYQFIKQDGRNYLLDGFERTLDDYSGMDDEIFAGKSPNKIVEEVLRNGLYHKTLILMRETGLAGLKIHVWQRSIERNFYQDKSIDEKKELFDHNQIEFFMALARFGLVEISPGKDIRNDLRAFIPKKMPEEVEPIFERYCKHRSHSIY